MEHLEYPLILMEMTFPIFKFWNKTIDFIIFIPYEEP